MQDYYITVKIGVVTINILQFPYKLIYMVQSKLDTYGVKAVVRTRCIK